MRIGIGKPPSKEQGADHVLATFTAKDRAAFDVAV
ncbi:MAG: Peptidyl-tRNA hydrolase, partial [Actinomycetota bacterium]